jgi:hypothetical protein
MVKWNESPKFSSGATIQSGQRGALVNCASGLQGRIYQLRQVVHVRSESIHVPLGT